MAAGLSSDKLLRVAGMGSRVTLPNTRPSDDVNRRISIVVLDNRAAKAIEQQEQAPLSESVPMPAEESEVTAAGQISVD